MLPAGSCLLSAVLSDVGSLLSRVAQVAGTGVSSDKSLSGMWR